MTNEDICKEIRFLKNGTRQELNYLYISWEISDAIQEISNGCWDAMPDLIIGSEFAWRTENE